MNNILAYSKKECCGCGVCAYKCPKQIIRLKSDEEGFLYPSITDAATCIHCGLCTQNCPVHHRPYAVTTCFDSPRYAYNPIVDRCKESASGGVAAGLYQAFLAKGGVACGVCYTPDFKDLCFEVTEKMEDIPKFLGSKYVKAQENGMYQKVEQVLNTGKQVLVIALPCEIAALKQFLNGDWPNLYTCELICHGPTSPSVLSHYTDSLETQQGSPIVAFSSRAKHPYWKPYYLYAKFENGQEIYKPFATTPLEKAFQVLKRPSCNACAFKAGTTCSDLIIGDYHGAKKETEEYNEYGVSVCFANTQKGREMIEVLQESGFVVGFANPSRGHGNRALQKSLPKLAIRKRFFKIFKTKGLQAATTDRIVVLGLKKRRLDMKLKMYFKVLLKKLKLYKKDK